MATQSIMSMPNSRYPSGFLHLALSPSMPSQFNCCVRTDHQAPFYTNSILILLRFFPLSHQLSKPTIFILLFTFTTVTVYNGEVVYQSTHLWHMGRYWSTWENHYNHRKRLFMVTPHWKNYIVTGIISFYSTSTNCATVLLMLIEWRWGKGKHTTRIPSVNTLLMLEEFLAERRQNQSWSRCICFPPSVSNIDLLAYQILQLGLDLPTFPSLFPGLLSFLQTLGSSLCFYLDECLLLFLLLLLHAHEQEPLP